MKKITQGDLRLYYTVQETNEYFVKNNSYLRAVYLKEEFGFFKKESGWAIISTPHWVNDEKIETRTIYEIGKLLFDTNVVIFEASRVHELSKLHQIVDSEENISFLNRFYLC